MSNKDGRNGRLVAAAVLAVVALSRVKLVDANISSEMKNCMGALALLSPCLAFVKGDGGRSPDASCCEGLRKLLDNNMKCLCILGRDDANSTTSLHIPFNVIFALELPFLCNRRVNASNCLDVLNLSPDSPDARIFKQYAGYIDNLQLVANPPISASVTSASIACTRYWRCHERQSIALTAGFVSAIFLLAMFVAFLMYRKHKLVSEAKEKLRKERAEILSTNSGGRSIKLFRGKEIKKATNSFCKGQLLGSGGFGEVYKGTLEDGTLVAVKVAKIDSSKSTVQVLNEVSILSQVNHRSLVRLLGGCVELEQPLLVSEFIPNGTLHDHIHTSKYGFLNWQQRLKIAYQAAEGIAYLHSSAIPQIYHRDIKSRNILLDSRCNAKVSDFGLSRLVKPDMTHISTYVQGTIGYVDPEYYRSYKLTAKSDVYSFGVVLLELLTSQKVIDHKRGDGDASLAVYVHHKMEEGRIMDVVDKNLTMGASQSTVGLMKAICCLALSCLEEKEEDRPSMKDIVEEIEYMISADSSFA